MLIGATVVCLLVASAAAEDPVDRLVRQEMSARHIQGAALAVIEEGRIVKKSAYGLANVELGAKVKIDSVFEIGSVTKQFTAALVMMLAQEGKLSLDQPIVELLPGAPPAWKDIKLRHLLGHMSGLPNINAIPGFEVREHLTYEKFVARLKDHPLEFKPGDKYAYRNTGYALAGYVVQQVCKKPYWQVLREHILAPVGMAASRDRDPHAIIPNRCAGYEWAEGKLLNRGTDLTDISAAGALVSNIPDLIKWNAALDEGKLLRPECLKAMWTPGTLNDGKSTGYGLGWGIGKYKGETLISHGGSTAGFSASISKFVDRRLTVIVLTNCETLNNASDIARAVAELYIGFRQGSR